MRYAQAILPMNTSNLWTVPGKSPTLGRWLESSRNSLDFHVSPAGTSPILLHPQASWPPSSLHWTTLEAQDGKKKKRQELESTQSHPVSKTSTRRQKPAFLETREQMSDGSNLSSNKFVFYPLC